MSLMPISAHYRSRPAAEQENSEERGNPDQDPSRPERVNFQVLRVVWVVEHGDLLPDEESALRGLGFRGDSHAARSRELDHREIDGRPLKPLGPEALHNTDCSQGSS